MNEYTQMWIDLDLNLARHQNLLDGLGAVYPELFLNQENRPKGMEYFDFVISEVHGLRVKELVDHKKEGGKVVGTFCVFVPDEIILAAGGIPVGLCGGAQFGIFDAEMILPRTLCPLIKSFFGFKLGRICPYFQACDFVVGETTCDGKKKVWELLDEHIPTYVMDLPQKKSSAGRDLWVSELYAFKAMMEERTGQTIDAERLGRGIEVANAKRAALKRLFMMRKSDQPVISGKDALLISQIAFYDDAERFTQKTEELNDELEGRVERGQGVASGARLMISGCPMAIPNWKLHHLIETSGGVVVCEETCTGTRYFTDLVENGSVELEGKMKALADRYLKINCACFTPNDERINEIVSLAREYQADGVVYYVLQFCHTYNVEFVKIKKRLESEGIPLLKIETDYSEEDVGQLRTRIEAFIEQVS